MITVSIAGHTFPTESIRGWESWRTGVSVRLLERKLGKDLSGVTTAEDLARVKYGIPQAVMLGMLRNQIRLTEAGTQAVVRMSGGRRAFSTTEIDVDFCDAATLKRYYDDMMLDNTEQNRFSCLRANPDHYLLRGVGQNVQEVLEFVGAMPLVSHFYICYGDFDGLRSPQDPDYPYQAAGVSYLENGLAIGAVRHQMKDTENGCHVKLTVEFPSLMPERYIIQHRYHLACEFFNWFSDIEKRVRAAHTD